MGKHSAYDEKDIKALSAGLIEDVSSVCANYEWANPDRCEKIRSLARAIAYEAQALHDEVVDSVVNRKPAIGELRNNLVSYNKTKHGHGY